MTAGSINACALSFSGAVYCWGDNSYGEAGNGAFGSSIPTPTLVTRLSAGVARLGGGNGSNFAVTYSGDLLAWGLNAYSMLGSGSVDQKMPNPVHVLGLPQGIQSVGGGSDYHTCALTTTNHVWCWGHNGNSELGPNAPGGDRSLTPVFVL